jgi:hypothetical protein
MPVRRLPANPDLAYLKYQAKDLCKAHATRQADAAQRLREFLPRFLHSTDGEIFASPLTLSGAQLAIAREYGFPSWTRLKRHVENKKPTESDLLNLPLHERIEDANFRRAVELIDAGDVDGLRAHLKQYPKLAQQHVEFEGGNYFRNPSLLEFIAENPVRHGRLPNNIVEVAKAILDAGVETAALSETLMLVATGSVARECRQQIPLINLLCDHLLRNHGADLARAALLAAQLHELASVNALLDRGAPLTLPIAAALGRLADARRLLPDANSNDRHLALTLAADHGHAEIVRLLLDAGEDPDRYNPVGGHSHATPLHQAAGAGHAAVVHLLVERGGRLDMKDILWQATPADWANHAGQKEIEDYLRKKAKNEI